MSDNKIASHLRDSFADPRHPTQMLWKNSQSSAFRKLAEGADISAFSLQTSGLCCFDLCIFAGHTWGEFERSQIKSVYAAIVSEAYKQASPLISGPLMTIDRKELGGGKSMSSDPQRVSRLPLAGELVFFFKPLVGQLAHVAYACDDAGGVISFGHDATTIAANRKLSQQTLNQQGLELTVAHTTVSALWPLFNSTIYCAAPIWDPHLTPASQT